LWRELLENQAMLGLAQTPLLLTLICVAYHQAGRARRPRLPAARCELYAECLDGLLGRWPSCRSLGVDPILSPAEVRTLRLMRDLLGEVAWHLAGRDPDHTLFTQIELERALEAESAKQLRQELEWGSVAALTELGQAYGVLTRGGHGADAQYLFLHRTFQEYLLGWRWLAARTGSPWPSGTPTTRPGRRC
jgi:predicted NACHT family NTPase